MKKLVTMLLIFVMLAAFAVSASAEEGGSNPVTLNWISARRALMANELNGSYYEIEDFGMDIWIPDLLTPLEDIDPDCYYVFTDNNEVVTVKVHRVSIEGETTLSGIEKIITEEGAISDGVFWINGYNALVYEVKETDTLAVVIPFDDGDVIEFAFDPISNQDVYTLTSIIMSTIQPHELGVEDVAMMIDADLNSNWGPNRKVAASRSIFGMKASPPKPSVLPTGIPCGRAGSSSTTTMLMFWMNSIWPMTCSCPCCIFPRKKRRAS